PRAARRTACSWAVINYTLVSGLPRSTACHATRWRGSRSRPATVTPNTTSRGYRSCSVLPDPDWEFIRVARQADGHVLWVTIDRPEVRNALHPPASRELGRAWDVLEAETDLRVGVLIGAGDRAFCAGFDLKWAQHHPEPLDQRNVALQGGFG